MQWSHFMYTSFIQPVTTSKLYNDVKAHKDQVHFETAYVVKLHNVASLAPAHPYPRVFEEPVIENIKSWVMDDTARFSGEERHWKHDMGKMEASDSEIIKCYSTGLLAVCLAGGGQVVEDVLTSGLSAKLKRFLRIRVFVETSTNQKDATYLMESKNLSAATCVRGREEGRGRVRQVLEATHVDNLSMNDERTLDNPIGGEPPDRLVEGVDLVDDDGGERWNNRDPRDGKIKFGDLDESGKDDSSRRRPSRGVTRPRGKGRANEAAFENEQALTSPGSGSRSGQGRSTRERILIKNLDLRRGQDARKYPGNLNPDAFVLEREDTDDCFQECKLELKTFLIWSRRQLELLKLKLLLQMHLLKPSKQLVMLLLKLSRVQPWRNLNLPTVKKLQFWLLQELHQLLLMLLMQLKFLGIDAAMMTHSLLVVQKQKLLRMLKNIHS